MESGQLCLFWGGYFLVGAFLHPLPSHSSAFSVDLHGSWPSKFMLMLSILNTM